MAEKDSTLVLEVDLECSCSYKKIKKILCKFHEIRDQKFDMKNNTVTIIGPFSPDKMAKKLSCKAGKTIKSISVEEKKKENQKETEQKTKEQEKPAPKPEPVLVLPYPIGVCCRPCYDGCGMRPCYDGCGCGRKGYVSRCDYFIYEENPSCMIM